VAKKVPVLAFDWSKQGEEVERTIAREMVATGEYSWCNSSRAIRSLKRDVDGPSLHPSPSALGASDMEALAGQHFKGGRLVGRHLERFKGWSKGETYGA
jgi:hypothetical protein